ncbi:class I SAM-dependent methyltransferase [Tolypothrix sp. VBCCA 56010]|uniref:class I SAM-dependent methyltransferase n=1 Tax=Tolypothrix sp. VBCCA 56010 TaxID=3137731 RepID=UPI003D7DEE7F
MAVAYDQVAHIYKEIRDSDTWYFQYVGDYTFFKIIGDVTEKAIFDFGCGEGTHARIFKQMGAKRVVGVDISQKMLELAKEAEAINPLGIEYIQGDMCELGEFGSFDLGVSFSVLSTIPTKEQLLKVCQAIYANLKPQGRYVTVGLNPDLSPDIWQLLVESFPTSRIEFFQEDPVRFIEIVDEKECIFEDYLLKRETYEWAFRTVGFKDICWHPPRVSPEGVQNFSKELLQIYINHQFLVGLECFK